MTGFSNRETAAQVTEMILADHLCACLPSHFSRIGLFAALWTIARQAPLSMGYSRQEFWSGLPYVPLEDLPNPGTKPMSLKSPALAGRFFTSSATWETLLVWLFLCSMVLFSILCVCVCVCVRDTHFS